MNTPRAEQVLRFCGEFVEQWGFSPTVREIQHGCGLSSPAVAFYNLRKLRAAGAIDFLDGTARTIRILQPAGKGDRCRS